MDLRLLYKYLLNQHHNYCTERNYVSVTHVHRTFVKCVHEDVIFFHLDALFDRNPSQEARVADPWNFSNVSLNKLLIKHWSGQWSDGQQGSYGVTFFHWRRNIHRELGQCHGCCFTPLCSGHNVWTYCGLNKIVHILTYILKCISFIKMIFSLSNRQ